MSGTQTLLATAAAGAVAVLQAWIIFICMHACVQVALPDGPLPVPQVAQDVPPELLGSPWLLGLVEQMIAVMRAAPGVGLAAPQIGQPWKVRACVEAEQYTHRLSPSAGCDLVLSVHIGDIFATLLPCTSLLGPPPNPHQHRTCTLKSSAPHSPATPAIVLHLALWHNTHATLRPSAPCHRPPTCPRAPLQVIVLEDREEYIARQATSGAYSPEQLAALERRPFAPLALVNPVLRPVGQQGAAFFEGCLSVKGYAVGPLCPAPAAPRHALNSPAQQ